MITNIKILNDLVPIDYLIDVIVDFKKNVRKLRDSKLYFTNVENIEEIIISGPRGTFSNSEKILVQSYPSSKNLVGFITEKVFEYIKLIKKLKESQDSVFINKSNADLVSDIIYLKDKWVHFIVFIVKHFNIIKVNRLISDITKMYYRYNDESFNEILSKSDMDIITSSLMNRLANYNIYEKDENTDFIGVEKVLDLSIKNFIFADMSFNELLNYTDLSTDLRTDIVCDLLEQLSTDVEKFIIDMCSTIEKEVVDWIKTPKKEDRPAIIPIYEKINIPKILVELYNFSINLGDTNSKIAEYEKIIELLKSEKSNDTNNNEELINDNYKMINSINVIKYKISSLFDEICSNEDVVKQSLTPNEIVYILTGEPDINNFAYCIHNIINTLNIKSDFTRGQSINPFYTHATKEGLNLAVEEDIFLADLLSMVVNFNLQHPTYLSCIYNKDRLDYVKKILRLSFVRFIDGLLENYSKSFEKFNNVYNNDYSTQIEDRIENICKSFISFIETTKKEVLDSSNDENDDDSYENNIDSDYYDNVSKEIETSLEKYRVIMKDMNSLINSYFDNKDILETNIVNFWPIRTYKKIEHDDECVKNVVSSENEIIRNLKPGDIFSDKINLMRQTFINKTPCGD